MSDPNQLLTANYVGVVLTGTLVDSTGTNPDVPFTVNGWNGTWPSIGYTGYDTVKYASSGEKTLTVMLSNIINDTTDAGFKYLTIGTSVDGDYLFLDSTGTAVPNSNFVDSTGALLPNIVIMYKSSMKKWLLLIMLLILLIVIVIGAVVGYKYYKKGT